jgi:hypothetical protein
MPASLIKLTELSVPHRKVLRWLLGGGKRLRNEPSFGHGLHIGLPVSVSFENSYPLTFYKDCGV